VLTQAGRPYTVFTPYRNAWLKRLTTMTGSPTQPETGVLAALPGAGVPTLAEIGFPAAICGARHRAGDVRRPAAAGRISGRMARYRQQRDFPALQGGFVSLGSSAFRDRLDSRSGGQAMAAGALRAAAEGAATWLSELIWRDFYFMILDRFPQVTERAFKPAYDAIAWEQGPRRMRPLPPGVWDAPAIRWSMPRCGRSTDRLHA
jgi:deoxyribodipyrimidine photo-lyase